MDEIEQVASLNWDAITVDDARLLYYEDKRLLLNDGHVIAITQIQSRQEV